MDVCVGTSSVIPRFWNLMGKIIANKDIIKELGDNIYDNKS